MQSVPARGSTLRRAGVFALLGLSLMCTGLTLADPAAAAPERIGDRLGQLLDDIPADRVPTGILYDRVLPISRIDDHDGGPASATADLRAWRQMYDEIQRASLAGPRWPALAEVSARARKTAPGVVPIGVLNVLYDRLRADALASGALVVEGDRIAIGAGDPCVTRRVFAIAPLREHTYRGDAVTFRLDAGAIAANDPDGATPLQFDFDDGNGFVTLSSGAEHLVRYAAPGTKTIRARTRLSDGTLLQAAARFDVRALRAPAPHDTLQITGSIPYQGAVAAGQAYVYLSDQHTVLANPVIVIEGFDLDNSMGWDELYDLLNRQMLLETLRAEGYDAVVLDFTDATDYLQRNAFVAVELIEQVRALLPPDLTIALAGASMGGLVGRYALAYMEAYELAHGVRTFISFDGPQTGADIPLGVQYWLWFFAEQAAEAAAWLEALDSPAARQLLLYHHTDPPGTSGESDPLRAQMLAELAALGDYPVQPRLVAVANGSGTRMNQGYAAGAQLVEWEYNGFLVDIVGNVWAVADQTSRMIFDGLINYLIGQDEDVSVTVSGTRPLDNAPGGWRSTMVDIDATDPGYGDIVALHPNHCFIPTISALALATDDLFYDIAGDPDLLAGTPFDAVYFPVANQEHVEITAENAPWLIAEIELGAVAVDGPPPAPARIAFVAPPAPNPVAGNARIHCTVPVSGRVRLTLHDTAGRCIALLAEGHREAGLWETAWNGRTPGGSRVPAGVYFVHLKGEGFAATARAVVR